MIDILIVQVIYRTIKKEELCSAMYEHVSKRIKGEEGQINKWSGIRTQ